MLLLTSQAAEVASPSSRRDPKRGGGFIFSSVPVDRPYLHDDSCNSAAAGACYATANTCKSHDGGGAGIVGCRPPFPDAWTGASQRSLRGLIPSTHGCGYCSVQR